MKMAHIDPSGVDADNRAALTAKITAALTANRAALEYLGSACPHCKSTLRVGHMGGNTWGIETFHEAACPDAYQNAVEPPEDDSATQE